MHSNGLQNMSEDRAFSKQVKNYLAGFLLEKIIRGSEDNV